jgi:hypothetical protein
MRARPWRHRALLAAPQFHRQASRVPPAVRRGSTYRTGALAGDQGKLRIAPGVREGCHARCSGHHSLGVLGGNGVSCVPTRRPAACRCLPGGRRCLNGLSPAACHSELAQRLRIEGRAVAQPSLEYISAWLNVYRRVVRIPILGVHLSGARQSRTPPLRFVLGWRFMEQVKGQTPGPPGAHARPKACEKHLRFSGAPP